MHKTKTRACSARRRLKAEGKQLNRHYPDFLLHFSRIHHHDRVPGAPIQERAVRAVAGALLATDTQNWDYLAAAKRRVVLIRNPEHAVLDRAVLPARW